MFCENCGKRIDDGAMFCENCGTRVNGTPGMHMPQHIPDVSDYVAGEKKQKSNMLPVIIVIVSFVIILALVIGGLVFMKKNKDKQQDAMEELYNITEETQEEVEESEENTHDFDVNESDDYYDIPEYEEPSYEVEEEPQYSQNSDYILYDSDSRYISKSELYGLSATECRLARNEIYARHGRMFDDEMLQSYFNEKSWYYPSIEPDDFSNSMLNKYEKANAETITEYEKEQGYR